MFWSSLMDGIADTRLESAVSWKLFATRPRLKLMPCGFGIKGRIFAVTGSMRDKGIWLPGNASRYERALAGFTAVVAGSKIVPDGIVRPNASVRAPVVAVTRRFSAG